MPKIVQKLVYSFDELSDSAKNSARDYFRDNSDFDYEFIFEDCAHIAELFGLDIRTRKNKNSIYSILFSGFYSQGDGACFEGNYRYKKGALKNVMDYAPNDKILHDIVKTLQEIQKVNFYGITANTYQNGFYYHSGNMRVIVESNYNTQLADETEDNIIELLRNFADWIFTQLEKEYNYQNLDSTIDENILINEYQFDENGKLYY